jgi:hypothetical protein
MSLADKLIAEAKAEREETGIRILSDRNGNRCIAYPHAQPRYLTVITPDGWTTIHTEGAS